MKNRKVRFEVDRNDQELQRRAPGTSNTKIAPVVKTFKKNEMVVAVRCRPFNNREKDYNDMNVIKIDSGSIVTVMDIMKNEEANRNKVKEQQYAFDYAFDRDASQSTVYESTTQFLLKDVVEGFNATVLAYGATGAGKTYTMVGSPENPGVMVRSLSDIFKYIDAKDQKDFKIKITYVEVYNETIRDLLSDNIEVLEMREDPIKGVSLIGANETFVSSASEVFRCLVKGNKNRMEEATTSNENSSRSHAILQVNIEIKDKTTRLDNEIALGKFILVDLAGSERISGSNNSGIRILESANINKSLLALGVCINSLVDSSNKGGKNFIPWRDSKLTRLLKDSLSGNSRIVMIANISPSLMSIDDTMSTLKYANRAKNIKINIKKNIIENDYHISKYDDVITALRDEIDNLKQQLGEKASNIVVASKS